MKHCSGVLELKKVRTFYLGKSNHFFVTERGWRSVILLARDTHASCVCGSNVAQERAAAIEQATVSPTVGS